MITFFYTVNAVDGSRNSETGHVVAEDWDKAMQMVKKQYSYPVTVKQQKMPPSTTSAFHFSVEPDAQGKPSR